MLRNKVQDEVISYGSMAVKAISVQGTIIGAIAAQLFVLWLSTKGSLFPGEDALMQIIGTCAEIVAGLYGTTLAGYIFFLSRIDALTANDSTLDYIVSSVKNRFKYLIWYITITVAVTLLISVLLMYYPVSSNAIPVYFYRLICNEFVVFLGFSIGLILYYSLSVIDPNCISKEAAKLKRKLTKKFGPDGNTAEFISLYTQIEYRCNTLLPKEVLQQLHAHKGKQFNYTLHLLYEQYPDFRTIYGDLNRILRYYECTINCKTLYVSEEMCTLAKKVLSFLDIFQPYTL